VRYSDEAESALNPAYQTIPTPFVALGAVLILLGLVLLLRVHRKPFRPLVNVPTVGELSSVSHALIGMALAGAGYHLAVHALGLPQFRGPLRLSLVTAGVFIVCTILADSLDEAAGIRIDESEGDEVEDRPPADFQEPEKWDNRA
jgi:hypothetical protein